MSSLVSVSSIHHAPVKLIEGAADAAGRRSVRSITFGRALQREADAKRQAITAPFVQSNQELRKARAEQHA
jgi:hypothetical protein